MRNSENFYHSDISAKAVLELTNALNNTVDDAYASALLHDERMSGKKGHLASCGINTDKVSAAVALLNEADLGDEVRLRANEFLDNIDHEQVVFNE